METEAFHLYGVGYAQLQEDDTGNWCLVQCGSRFLGEVESWYAAIELELVVVSHD